MTDLLWIDDRLGWRTDWSELIGRDPREYPQHILPSIRLDPQRPKIGQRKRYRWRSARGGTVRSLNENMSHLL